MHNKNNSAPLKLTQYLYHKATQNHIPLSGTFELSPVCNFSCRMCYVRKTASEVAASPRPILQLDDWITIARDARDRGMLFLLLTGGEPFLWPDFWPLYEALIRMGFLVSINTNGSLINEEVVARLKRLPPFRINVTLYGADESTYQALCGAQGVFERVTAAIDRLKEAGIAVKLNCSLTPHNIQDLEKLVCFAEKRDLILSATAYMFPPIRRDPTMVGINDRFTAEEAARYRLEVVRRQSRPEQYRAYLQSIVNGYVEPPSLDEHCVDPIDGKIRCRAGNAAFWVTWDGWMTPCGMMNEPKVDLKAAGFTESWNSLTELSGRVGLSGICSNCGNQSICHPCAAMAQAETGDSAGIPQYLCRMAQEMKRIAALELEHS